MKHYAPENAIFKLPFSFDLNLLSKDLKIAEDFLFINHYVTSNFSRNYKLLPLRSINGDIESGFATETTNYEDTIVLDKCLYFKEVISTFKCSKNSIHIMSLPAGDVVNRHTDFECGYEDGFFRIHIPIKTNKKVEFNLDDKKINMKCGEAWYANFNLPHSVKNEGNTIRIHLVIDCIRNAWSDALFTSMGYNFELETKEEQFDRATTLSIIAELERQNTPAANDLIQKLKAKL